MSDARTSLKAPVPLDEPTSYVSDAEGEGSPDDWAPCFAVALEQLRAAHIRELQSLRCQLSDACLQEVTLPAKTWEMGAVDEGVASERMPSTMETPEAEKTSFNSAEETLSENHTSHRTQTSSKASSRVRSSKRRTSSGTSALAAIFVSGSEREDIAGGANRFQRLVEHPCFETFAAAVILINALVMAVEAQMAGAEMGVRLEYFEAGFDGPSWSRWANPIVEVLGWVFGVWFTVEILLKIIGLQTSFLKDPWNYFDSAIVVFWIIGKIWGAVLPINAQLLRLARLARLLRMLRLVHTIQGFDALYLMTTALKGSMSVLCWSVVVLFIVQLMLGLFVNQLLTDTYFFDETHPLKERQEVYVYFGSFTRSMLSMFEITLANWPPVCRLLSEKVSEGFILFSIAHKLTIGFAVVGVINGVFMQETFKVASIDDRIMMRQKSNATNIHRKKMHFLFELLDVDLSNGIDKSEFNRIVRCQEVMTWLASMELDATDVEGLHRLLDGDGDGIVTEDELVMGVAKLKGPARSLDLYKVRSEVQQLNALVERMLCRFDSLSGEAEARNADGIAEKQSARTRGGGAQNAGEACNGTSPHQRRV